MITRAHRFHGYNSLSVVYRRGQTVRNPQLSLKFVAQNHNKHYRLAIVVSRKVSKSAVVRNRIRRRLYETVRTHQDELAPSYDLVVTVFSDQLATMPYQELEALMTGLLTQAHAMETSNREAAQGGIRHDIVKRNGK
jgi:ribonuclease P protein component